MNKKSIIFRCLVASLCLVSLVVMTYSWFNRPNGVSANSMGFDRVMDLNDAGTNINVETHYSIDDGKTFTESLSRAADTGKLNSITTTLGPGGKLYFRTVITNSGSSKKTNVSVDLENSSFPSGIYIGTTSPVNTEKNVAGLTSVTIAKNVSVSNTDGAVIDWYIYLSPGTTQLNNIQLGNLLVYQV